MWMRLDGEDGDVLTFHKEGDACPCRRRRPSPLVAERRRLVLSDITASYVMLRCPVRKADAIWQSPNTGSFQAQKLRKIPPVLFVYISNHTLSINTDYYSVYTRGQGDGRRLRQFRSIFSRCKLYSKITQFFSDCSTMDTRAISIKLPHRECPVAVHGPGRFSYIPEEEVRRRGVLTRKRRRREGPPLRG